jgi:putative hydrolase of the HAD superfamily
MRYNYKFKDIKVIAFDFWGIFAEMNPPMNKYVKERGIKLEKYSRKIHSLIVYHDLGKISEEEFLQKCSKIIKLNLPYPLLKYVYKPKTLNSNLIKIIKKLKKKFKIVLISNNNKEYCKEYLFKTKLNKLFNMIILSYQVGYRKPSPKIYKILIRKTNCKPSDVLYIDDEKSKLPPAKKIGFKTLLYQRNKTNKLLQKF